MVGSIFREESRTKVCWPHRVIQIVSVARGLKSRPIPQGTNSCLYGFGADTPDGRSRRNADISRQQDDPPHLSPVSFRYCETSVTMSARSDPPG